MGLRGLLALTMAAGLAGTARAEVLPVSGVYPAGNDAAAAFNTIAVERFGGYEGEVLAFRIEDTLRQISIGGRPWFRILPGASPADGVLRGMATVETSASDFKQKREVCDQKDNLGKCTNKREVEVKCTRRVVRLLPEIRLLAADGALIHADDEAERTEFTHCEDAKDDPPSRQAVVRGLVARVADRLRLALAPVERDEAVRVLEKRDGLSREDAERFKQALRLTKTDPAAACRQWEAIAAANPAQLSTLFNLGLCAESAGEDGLAAERYGALLQLSARHAAAGARLDAIALRNRARAQIRAHGG